MVFTLSAFLSFGDLLAAFDDLELAAVSFVMITGCDFDGCRAVRAGREYGRRDEAGDSKIREEVFFFPARNRPSVRQTTQVDH